MKASLQLKMGQQLTMTPQLQQAIKLLQLSTLDLQQEVQQALESNPMLELAEEGEANEQAESSTENTSAENESENSEPNNSDHLVDLAESAPAASETPDDKEIPSDSEQEWDERIPDDLPVDSNWDDAYPTSAPAVSGPSDDDDMDFESRNSSMETLQDHLIWQLNLTPMSDVDRMIGLTIIDAINPDGYLTQTPEEILSAFERESEEDYEVELDEVLAVLHRIQRFDPVGVAAQDLRECLLLQLSQSPPDSPWLSTAKLVIENHLPQLGSRDYSNIMRRSKIKEEALKEAILVIQSLNPKPGSIIASSNPEYVIPDVVVKKVSGRWKVELNPEVAPKLRINSGYASLVKRADSSADNAFLRDNLQEARWFIKSLQSRNETLLKVATRIVEHQIEFLEHGEEYMKPLVLFDIAEAVSMHESTISRVTTQKYMHTPRGIFELKYFFSSHVSTASGGECSSTAIRAIIKKLIAVENAKKPLSDSKIATMLAEQGIKVARRTVAKYREAMQIPPSNERKRLI